MIHGGIPTIYVADMDRAVSFYVDTLGMKLMFRAGDHRASIDGGAGLVLGLHPASARGPAPGAAGSISVGLNVDEPIESVVAALEAKGVQFDGGINDEGYVKLAPFTDPDGNALYLSEEPKR